MHDGPHCGSTISKSEFELLQDENRKMLKESKNGRQSGVAIGEEETYLNLNFVTYNRILEDQPVEKV